MQQPRELHLCTCSHSFAVHLQACSHFTYRHVRACRVYASLAGTARFEHILLVSYPLLSSILHILRSCVLGNILRFLCVSLRKFERQHPWPCSATPLDSSETGPFPIDWVTTGADLELEALGATHGAQRSGSCATVQACRLGIRAQAYQNEGNKPVWAGETALLGPWRAASEGITPCLLAMPMALITPALSPLCLALDAGCAARVVSAGWAEER